MNNNKDQRLMFVITALLAVNMLAVSVVVKALFDDAETKVRSRRIRRSMTSYYQKRMDSH